MAALDPQQRPGRQRQAGAEDLRHLAPTARSVREKGTRQRPGGAQIAAPLPSSVTQMRRHPGTRLAISALKKASSRSALLRSSGSRCAQAGSSAKASASASAAASCSSSVAALTLGSGSASTPPA